MMPITKTIRALWAVSAAFAVAGCAARAGVPAGEPVADPAALSAELQRATIPASPRQATFAWSLNEAGSRVSGRGAVRFVAPERLRLDLFGPRGESYLTAALVDGEYRLPPNLARESLPLPSPALLWAALGVARAPEGATLRGASAADGVATLRYEAPGAQRFEFRARETTDGLRLEQVERIGASGVLESIGLEYSPEGEPQRVRYRDWAAYRELVLETETIKDVPSFPETIWSPGAAER